MSKQRHASTKYLVMLSGILIYLVVMVIPVLIHKVNPVWLLYGLLPSSFGICIAIMAYTDTYNHEKHLNGAVKEILTYVKTLAGVDDNKVDW